MRYSTIAALQARSTCAWQRLLAARGQGTVEYVALILLVAGVLATVVAAAGSFGGKDIGQTIVTKLKEAIDSVGGSATG
jgi:hypothetical protein